MTLGRITNETGGLLSLDTRPVHTAGGFRTQSRWAALELSLKVQAAKAVILGFTSRYWVHWDAKPKRSGRDIRFYVPVKKNGT